MAANPCHHLALAAAALLLTLLATLVQVRAAPLAAAYSPYSLAEPGEAAELRSPGGPAELRSPREPLLLRRLLEDLRSGEIKYRPRERRVPYPLGGGRLYRRSRSFCLHLGDTSCKDGQFIGALEDSMRFLKPGSSPGK